MTIELYLTVYKVLPHLFGLGSDFSAWPSSWIDPKYKLPGQRASSSPNFPQTMLKVTVEKWTEFIIHFESIQTSEFIYQRTLEGYHRGKLNIFFFIYLNFNFVIFTVELIKELKKKKPTHRKLLPAWILRKQYDLFLEIVGKTQEIRECMKSPRYLDQVSLRTLFIFLSLPSYNFIVNANVLSSSIDFELFNYMSAILFFVFNTTEFKWCIHSTSPYSSIQQTLKHLLNDMYEKENPIVLALPKFGFES